MSSVEKVMTITSKFVPQFLELAEDKGWWWQSEDPFCFHADVKTCRHMCTMYWLNKTLSRNTCQLVQ